MIGIGKTGMRCWRDPSDGRKIRRVDHTGLWRKGVGSVRRECKSDAPQAASCRVGEIILAFAWGAVSRVVLVTLSATGAGAGLSSATGF